MLQKNACTLCPPPHARHGPRGHAVKARVVCAAAALTRERLSSGWRAVDARRFQVVGGLNRLHALHPSKHFLGFHRRHVLSFIFLFPPPPSALPQSRTLLAMCAPLTCFGQEVVGQAGGDTPYHAEEPEPPA